VAYCLRNQKDNLRTLNFISNTWFDLLELAGEYGWNQFGVFSSGYIQELEVFQDDHLQSHYPYGVSSWFLIDGHETNRVVSLEEALSLADALERAFLDYEPRRVPASYYLFEPAGAEFQSRPSIGAIAELVDFCRYGAFRIEQYQRIG
jgi:hypothetical protein